MSAKLQNLLYAVEQERDRLAAVVVHVNDTYLLGENPDLGLPGFPRVIATVRRVREHVKQVLEEDRTLVLHSGDFLGPSRTGRETHGSVMVDVLTKLGLDWCVLGNHEFDYGDRVLVDRLGDAAFGITLANVTSGALKLVRHVIWPSARQPLVALTGIVSETVHRSFPPTWSLSSPSGSLFNVLEVVPSSFARACA